MEEATPPPPPPAAAGAASASCTNRLKSNWLHFTASLTEQARYVKAFFIGQAKKLTARNEKEVAEADLRTAKMQVEAADAAEDTKRSLTKAM